MKVYVLVSECYVQIIFNNEQNVGDVTENVRSDLLCSVCVQFTKKAALTIHHDSS